jgi:hypothetical protein
VRFIRFSYRAKLPVTGTGALASAPACQYCIRTSEAEECRDKSD